MEQKEQDNSIEELIKKTVQELVAKMGFPAEVEVNKVLAEDEKETITCNIKTEESNFLIGQYGVNLQSLQHVARLLVRKKTDERVNFTVDVNFYRQEKNDSIEKMAREAAEQALREKRAVVMRPMSPYERRIVHMELAGRSDVKTESIGEEPDRKIVIKPSL